MQFQPSIMGQLLEPISRRWFQGVVERHKGDAYGKSFDSWSHLVALIYAQLASASSTRAVEAGWNANSNQHFHLGAVRLAKSTLADANQRRPTAIFAETFAMLAAEADRSFRREGGEMIRLIDSTPIPLGKAVTWCTWNGRIRGLKVHVVYDPGSDVPRRVDITDATINDVEMSREIVIEAGAAYAFDKAYCDYRLWTKIHNAGAVFVTRKKDNARYRSLKRRPLETAAGDGFTIIDDHDVRLASKGNSKLAIPMRRIRVRRDDSRATLTLVTNDMARSAVAVAALYKARWQIELLFRWLKQNLKLSKFMGVSRNAIHLQILAAMIAFLLLRIAQRRHRVKLPAIRFAGLVADMLFVRKHVARIDKPPPVNPSRPKPRHSPDQLNLCYQ